MDFSTKTLDAKSAVTAVKTGALVVGIYENRKLSKAASALDKLGAISAALKSGDISGKPGSTLLLRGVTGIAAERIVLLGLGAEEEIADKSFAAASAGLVRCLATLGCDDAALALPFDGIKGRDLAWAIRNVVLAGRDAIYRSDTLKSKKDPAPTGVKKITLLVNAADGVTAKAALGEAVALANGMALTKELGNLPGNVCTPTYLANTAKKLAKDGKPTLDLGAVRTEFADAHPEVVDVWRRQQARALDVIHTDPAAAAKAIAAEVGLSPAAVEGQLEQGVYLTPAEVASPEWLGSEGNPGNIASNLQSASTFLAEQNQIPSAASLTTFQDAIYTKGLPDALKQ